VRFIDWNVIGLAVLAGALCACKQKSTPAVEPVLFVAPASAPTPSPARAFVAVAAGTQHGLALDDQGMVHAWGQNQNGQTQVPSGLRNVVQIAAGSDFSLALRADGTVVAWGDPMGLDEPLPALPGNVVRIAAASRHFVLVLSDGSARIYGFMAKEGKTPRLRGIVDAAVGQGFVLLLNKVGKVELWMPGETDRALSLPRFLQPVKAIAAGARHGLAWLGDNRVEAWGANNEGETSVPDLGPVKALAGGYSVSFALLADGSIRHWGNRKSGEDAIPPGLGKAKAVAAGHYTCTLAISESGKLFAWGFAQNPCVTQAPGAGP
jgi:alpha-tubulin suppressor-like RCC1 family protein